MLKKISCNIFLQKEIVFHEGLNAIVGDDIASNSIGKSTINPDCHDRLIVLDYDEETELVYHCGASSKDAGKKLCAINQITENEIIHPVIDRLLLLPDKQI